MFANQKTPFLRESINVAIRRLAANDREGFVALVESSTEFLQPWAYLPNTLDKFDTYLRRFDGASAECLLICARKTGNIVGTVSISDIIRSSYQRGTVGYNAFANSARQGHMSEGMRLVFKFAFEDLELHRLEADIQPGNTPSLEFARKVGFRHEGYSPGFIRINGAWKDHERWAVNSDMIDA